MTTSISAALEAAAAADAHDRLVGRFVAGYEQAAEFCSDECPADGVEPLGWHPSTSSALEADAQAFFADNEELLLEATTVTGRSLEDAGGDFYLTRNGHGAGFWDGDWAGFGDRLTAACRPYGPVELYVGDDGWIYSSGDEPAVPAAA